MKGPSAALVMCDILKKKHYRINQRMPTVVGTLIRQIVKLHNSSFRRQKGMVHKPKEYIWY